MEELKKKLDDINKNNGETQEGTENESEKNSIPETETDETTENQDKKEPEQTTNEG